MLKNSLYVEFKSGFRVYHSTETSLPKVKNDLLILSDNAFVSVLVLLDLSPASDTELHQSEITKINVAMVCNFARTMSNFIVFSGPLPNLTSDDMFCGMSSFNRWLSRWCPGNNVGYIDN